MKRGFLLNGSGQPLARWKGEKWLSARQLLLSAGFCQVRSHSFFFFFPPPPPPPCLFLFILGERLRCAPCRKEDRKEECIADGGSNALWTGLGAYSEQGAWGGSQTTLVSILHPPPSSHYLWNFRSCFAGCAGEDQPARVAMIACCLSLLVSKRRRVKAFSQMRAEGCVPGRSCKCV